MNRPLPSGRMTVGLATLLTLVMGISGLVLLYIFTTPLTAALGLFNIIWYNGVYTPLKRHTGFVVIVGAVTGAIPPLMGWVAAGGQILDPRILFISVFFFLWQIPHFLLLLLKYKDDYRKAGFRTVTTTMGDNQIKYIVFIWIVSTSLITMFFPLFGIISGKILIACIIFLNLLLVSFFYRSVFKKNLNFNLGRAFGFLYLYQLSILAILIFQALK
jgi:protoheme IX farnesyltransferase